MGRARPELGRRPPRNRDYRRCVRCAARLPHYSAIPYKSTPLPSTSPRAPEVRCATAPIGSVGSGHGGNLVLTYHLHGRGEPSALEGATLHRLPGDVTTRHCAHAMSEPSDQPTVVKPTTRSRRGQSLLEFAFVLPLLLMLVGGIVQYGAIYAADHSLIQIGRDVGRWAATRQDATCIAASTATPPQPVTEADRLATEAGLFGYGGDWSGSNFVVYSDNSALPASPPSTEGVEVVWSYTAGDPCPPLDSKDEAFVTIRLSHRIPMILPGFPYLPGFGTCDPSGCYFTATTTAEFRMEPAP